jgi:mannose-6-phosphate isomerase-like protein (cupin superfamily)
MVVFGHLFTFLATTGETNGRYSIYEDHVPPLAGPPPHSHPDEELFYIIEGDFQFVLHDPSKPFSVSPGQLIKVPSNAIHTFKNVGTSMGRLLTILFPGNLEKYFQESFPVVDDKAQLPDLNKTPDFENMDLSLAFINAEKHGLKFYLPETAPSLN